MLGRLAREWHSRTAGGFLGWMGTQLLRRQSHVLFCLDLPAPAPAPRSIESVEINARNFAELEKLRSDLVAINAENIDYLDDVRRGAAVGLALLEEDHIVHYAFVFLRNKTACLLGLAARTALIGNAYTLPSHRGRGLQAYSVQCRAQIAQSAGFTSIVCETSPDNLASQRGLERAAMHRIGRMELLVLVNCAVVRWRRPAGFRLLGLCL